MCVEEWSGRVEVVPSFLPFLFCPACPAALSLFRFSFFPLFVLFLFSPFSASPADPPPSESNQKQQHTQIAGTAAYNCTHPRQSRKETNLPFPSWLITYTSSSCSCSPASSPSWLRYLRTRTNVMTTRALPSFPPPSLLLPSPPHLTFLLS